MSEEIVMPRLSDTMDRGTIAHWNKRTGDHVQRGEVLLEIETDKANMELESYSDGILARIMVEEGQTANVGAPIGIVARDETELKEIVGSGNGKPWPAHEKTAGKAPVRDAPKEPQPADTLAAIENGRVKASPLARRIAQQRGINLFHVSGTGPGGRIVREDVESFVDAPGSQSSPAAATPRTEPIPVPAPTTIIPAGADEQIALSRMQQTVASRLSQSMTTAPHFYVTAEIDMSHAVRMRAQINDAEPDLKVSFNDLIVKAVSVTLRRFPQVNASFSGDTVTRHGSINVGIAVDLPGGLIVPVLKDADRKTLRELATETRSLVAAARESRLKPDNFEGGTFTVSNLGMYGVDQFTAIINPPESAILAVGAIQEKPVVVDGEIVVRSRLRVTLSCDHRVIYGADAAAFLAELRRTLEHPVLALI